jgi:hypothetical protein
MPLFNSFHDMLELVALYQQVDAIALAVSLIHKHIEGEIVT